MRMTYMYRAIVLDCPRKEDGKFYKGMCILDNVHTLKDIQYNALKWSLKCPFL